jgi:ABC-type Fe3+-hydroxamate transport system substrate-binding protein
MIEFQDQLGRIIHLPHYPARIVSVVPSQTELLYDLGLRKEVIGITKFCVHPQEWFRTKARVGGTKTLNTAIIDSLQPDLIIANKEENTREEIEALAAKYQVWISDVTSLDSALQMILYVGDLTNRKRQAGQLANKIREEFQHLRNHVDKIKYTPRTGYLIWREPYITVGRDTFINDMLKACGMENVFEHLTRYPEIQIEQLQEAGRSGKKLCDLLLLSSEPYPFGPKHIDELQVHLPKTRIELVDGEMFSWYGSRLLKTPEYFERLLARLTI